MSLTPNTPQNRQEEWYQQMINASTGNYLPSIDSQDAGKVLTVANDGSWEVAEVPTELPSVTGTDKGKVLTVDAQGTWEAASVPTELPTVSGSDEGKVLTVTSNGTWQADNIPTEIPTFTSDDNGKVLAIIDGELAFVYPSDIPTPNENTPPANVS